MNYPVWDVPFGSAWLIIWIGIVTVFVSHIAVGGALFLVVVETRGHRHGDVGLLAWLKLHARIYAVLTLVLGVLSGVGTLFTICLISPEATSVLIRTFLWVWAIQWVFLVVQILAVLVYTYGWDRLPRVKHLIVGWIVFLSAFLSLVALTPVLSFQLTPGRWLVGSGQGGTLADAFFNPGFLPSVLVRTLMCLMLGGLFAMLTVSLKKDRPLRAEVAKYASFWVWTPSFFLAPAVYWYLSAVTPSQRSIVITDTFVRNFMWGLLLMGGLVVLLSFALVWFKPRFLNAAVAAALLFLAFGAVGSIEWVREDLRKPYLVSGYLFANQVPVAALPSLRRQGLLPSSKWVAVKTVAQGREAQAGEEVFRIACSACHRPAKGFNALGPGVKGLDEPFLASVLARSDEMRHAMPPFPGNAEESAALAKYLLAQAPPGPVAMDGRAIWRRRCGFCHTVWGPFRPVGDFYQGKPVPDVEGMLAAIDKLHAGMVPGAVPASERPVLAKALAGLTRPGGR